MRGLRESLGLSQLEFATLFGLDLDAVQNWEQGRMRPDRNARILQSELSATAPSAVEDALVGITPETYRPASTTAPIGRETL